MEKYIFALKTMIFKFEYYFLLKKKISKFNSIQYSASVANFMNDTTLKPDSDDWHPKIKDVAYHGMDWSCAG